jgi:hypothetical protein
MSATDHVLPGCPGAILGQLLRGQVGAKEVVGIGERELLDEVWAVAAADGIEQPVQGGGVSKLPHASRTPVTSYAKGILTG